MKIHTFFFICFSLSINYSLLWAQNLIQLSDIPDLFIESNQAPLASIDLNDFFSSNNPIFYSLEKKSPGILAEVSGDGQLLLSCSEGFYGKSQLEITANSFSQTLTTSISIHVSPKTINQNELVVKVCVLNFNPAIGGVPLNTFANWQSPYELTENFMKEVYNSSGNYLRYEIVRWENIDQFPIKEDGFQYTEASYLACLNNSESCHFPDRVDYLDIISNYQLNELIDENVIDEVWLFGGPYFGYNESAMTGPNSFYINGLIPNNDEVSRPYVVMGFNYERSVPEMLHNLSHRTEFTLGDRFYSPWNKHNPISDWDKFSAAQFYLMNSGSDELPGVGHCHFPFNGASDYDYSNQSIVETTALDWINYPDITGASTYNNAEIWGGPDYHLNYLKWWFSLFPKANGINANGKQNNWWKYLYDFSNYDATGVSVNTPPTDLGASLNIHLPINFGKYLLSDLSQVFIDSDVSALQFKIQAHNGELNNGVNVSLEGHKLYLHSQTDFTGLINFDLYVFDREFALTRPITVKVSHLRPTRPESY